MRNALVVGGSSGIGLSLVCELLSAGYDRVYVVSKDDIDYSALNKKQCDKFKSCVVFLQTNFVMEDYDVFKTIQDIDALFITIGFGRVSLFEDLSEPEITNLMRVNYNSVIRILRIYYSKIKSNHDFFTAVMVSICGRVSSPLFSVYGSCKGGIRFFIESINCELSCEGYKNRILDISPGALTGTKFNGLKNDLSALKYLSKEIIKKTFLRETLFIPQYHEVYKDVLERYISNPVTFGHESYVYKKENQRLSNKPQVIVGFLSGTFDLFHIGHLNLLRKAKMQCDYLIVSVHYSGAWKGKETFIPYQERCAILSGIKYVDEVVEDFKEDSDAWEKYHYHKLFVGSDYKNTERFNKYEKVLNGKAEIIYLPYTQGTSSTQLRKALLEKK